MSRDNRFKAGLPPTWARMASKEGEPCNGAEREDAPYTRSRKLSMNLCIRPNIIGQGMQTLKLRFVLMNFRREQ